MGVHPIVQMPNSSKGMKPNDCAQVKSFGHFDSNKVRVWVIKVRFCFVFLTIWSSQVKFLGLSDHWIQRSACASVQHGLHHQCLVYEQPWSLRSLLGTVKNFIRLVNAHGDLSIWLLACVINSFPLYIFHMNSALKMLSNCTATHDHFQYLKCVLCKVSLKATIMLVMHAMIYFK